MRALRLSRARHEPECDEHRLIQEVHATVMVFYGIRYEA